MPVQAMVNEFLFKLKKRKIEGSQATARHTAVLLRSVISQQRIPYTNQASALTDAVKAVGEQLIAANPVELAVGNIVRRTLHIIREEDLSLTNAAVAGMNLSAASDDEIDSDREDRPVLSAAAVAAASRSTLRPPSLQTLLEDMPEAAAVHHTSSSGGDSEGKSKCERNYPILSFMFGIIGILSVLYFHPMVETDANKSGRFFPVYIMFSISMY